MRHTFGGDIASYTIDLAETETDTRSGLTGLPAVVVGGQVVTFWNSQDGGEQYTDLLQATTGGPDDEGGEAISTVVTSAGAEGDPPLGSIPMFLGPENVTVMWAQVGDYSSNAGGGAGPVIGDDVPVETDDDGNPIDPVDQEDPEQGEDDPDGQETSTVPGGRLLIVASTAGFALKDEFDDFRDDVSNRVTTLEGRADGVDTHLQLHDNQITELQGRTNTGGGGSGGLVSGTTAQRPAPSIGALYLDYQKNRLWIGLTGYDNNPVWAPPPGTCVFKARKTTVLSMDDSGTYPMLWDQIDFDLLGGWRGTASPSRYVPKVPGYYLCTGAVSFSGNTQANARSVRYVQWRVTNAVIPPSATSVYTGSTSYTTVLPARAFSFYFNGQSDYVELVAYHNADVPLTTAITAFGQPGISITYQGGFGDAD